MMKYWTVIENKKEYEAALGRIGLLMDANPRTKTGTGKELKLLLYLVEKYEDEHYPIDLPDPIEAIKIRMDGLGLEAKDIV